MYWKRLSTKQLLDHPRIKVYEDIVQLPDGNVTDYLHFGEGTGGATIFPIDKNGKILIQKEYSYPPNQILYQTVGGGIKRDETPLQAAKRELSEEANITGAFRQIGWFYIDNRRHADKMYVFIATELKELKGQKDIEEDLEDFWLTEDEIDNLIRTEEFSTYSGLASWTLYKLNK
jgi:ADP-ribose pyrophosphatase